MALRYKALASNARIGRIGRIAGDTSDDPHVGLLSDLDGVGAQL